ncbi:HAD family hydrolase [Caldimonas sp. KR1-144]|uniref:HAD family hydrolase n=1 Tax=Caldimonas sp. KR1-144 TaxID=3400911 RepID=UPI003C09EBFC
MNAAAPAPRAVVFDLGGVLLHWQPRALLAELMPSLAGDAAAIEALFESVFQGFRPGGDWAEFDRGTVEPSALVARIAARSGLDARWLQRLVDAVPHHLVAQQATVALIERLHARDVPLYYLSNMPAPYADDIERRQPFFRCFRGGVFSSRLRAIKPEPQIFRHAESIFGHAPNDLLFIDDHAGNVDMARTLGWQALHFRGAAQCEAELRALGLI